MLTNVSVVIIDTVAEPTEQVTSHSVPQPPNGSKSAVVTKLHISPFSRDPVITQRGEMSLEKVPGPGRRTLYYFCREAPSPISHQDIPGIGRGCWKEGSFRVLGQPSRKPHKRPSGEAPTHSHLCGDLKVPEGRTQTIPLSLTLHTDQAHGIK